MILLIQMEGESLEIVAIIGVVCVIDSAFRHIGLHVFIALLWLALCFPFDTSYYKLNFIQISPDIKILHDKSLNGIGRSRHSVAFVVCPSDYRVSQQSHHFV